jgi:hypothetical protein
VWRSSFCLSVPLWVLPLGRIPAEEKAEPWAGLSEPLAIANETCSGHSTSAQQCLPVCALGTTWSALERCAWQPEWQSLSFQVLALSSVCTMQGASTQENLHVVSSPSPGKV